MGFIVLIILVGVVGFIALKISEARQNCLKKKIEEIRRQYPLAYKEFVSKNHISVSNAKNSTLATIVERSTYSWNEDEKRLQKQEQERQKRLQEEERKRRETETQYKEIEKLYPEGLKKWKRQNPYATKENTVLNRNKIKDFEKAVKKAFEFDNWEREQKEFTKKCRDLVDEAFPNFGCYPYEVPFRKTNEDGKSIDGKYLVWQSFAGSYCLESDLDYANFENIKRNTNNLNEFKSRKRHYLPPVYGKIQKYIEKLCEEYSVSIYLCANNEDWSAESLNYHYNMCDGTPFYGFPDIVEVCDPASDAWFEGVDLDYENYPKLKNRHIIIIEMQTDNDHLKTVCKNIIEKNKNKKPLITYISLLKGYDREEMLKLINEEKQKRKEEEERNRKEKEEEEKRKAELEKYKPNKEAIINLLRNNGINCFYHFTARDNLVLIRQHGGLYSWWSLKQKNIKAPFLGGEGFGQQLDVRHGLQDYVRLSFCDDHPMIFKHQQNGIDLVLLKIDIEVATWKDSLFSDINATDNNHHHGGSISDLKKVNFDAVKRNYVSRDDDDFKPHQAEVMVKTFIPAKYIINLDSPLPL
jgi:hypothetical protein